MKFVSKYLAIKLKEKGFDKPCFGYYQEDEFILNITSIHLPFGGNVVDTMIRHRGENDIVDAPTIEQVLEWLREEKNIIVTVGTFTNVSMSRFVIKIIQIVDKDSLTEHFLKGCIEKFYVNYDDAILAGIEYVVEHLI